jgi:hypothetical protein
MMFWRRSPFGVLLVVGSGVLLGAALFGGAGAVGSLVAAPFIVLGFLFKIVLFFLLFGLAVRLFAGTRRRGWPEKTWSGPSRQWSDETRARWPCRSMSPQGHEDKTVNDGFEEWHRMAHARQEVDDHTPPIEE